MTITCNQPGCTHSKDIDPAGDCACHSWNHTYEQLAGQACADEMTFDEDAMSKEADVKIVIQATRSDSGWLLDVTVDAEEPTRMELTDILMGASNLILDDSV